MQALLAALQTVAGATVARNEEEPFEVPAGGSILLRDGEAAVDLVILSPLTYAHRPEAEILVQVQVANAATRDTALDTLCQAVEAAIRADTTLGGTVDHVDLRLEQLETEPVEGGHAVVSAVVIAALQYESAAALG